MNRCVSASMALWPFFLTFDILLWVGISSNPVAHWIQTVLSEQPRSCYLRMRVAVIRVFVVHHCKSCSLELQANTRPEF